MEGKLDIVHYNESLVESYVVFILLKV